MKHFNCLIRNRCYCGHSYGKHGKASDTECNKLCPTRQGYLCGSVLRNSIYQTGSILTEINKYFSNFFKVLTKKRRLLDFPTQVWLWRQMWRREWSGRMFVSQKSGIRLGETLLQTDPRVQVKNVSCYT